MKLVYVPAKIPLPTKQDAERWLGAYNQFHALRTDYIRLNMSDLIRLSLRLYLDIKSPSKSFIPKK